MNRINFLALVCCLFVVIIACVAMSSPDSSGRFLQTPTKTPRGGGGTLESMTPGSGGSLKIGRRSRSKSPFRSFRWKRSTSRAIDGEYEDNGDFEGIPHKHKPAATKMIASTTTRGKEAHGGANL